MSDKVQPATAEQRKEWMEMASIFTDEYCAEAIPAYEAALQQAERERDLAIAHDRQPYPTAEAYEKVCAARTAWQQRAEAAEQRAEKAGAMLRDEWWCNHGCDTPAVYGDNGEQHCASCGIDFECMDLEELRLRVCAMRLKEELTDEQR